MTNKELINLLETNHTLERTQFHQLLTSLSKEDEAYLYERARTVRHQIYDKDVYLRGLIEFSNYCKNNCLYCGIRRENTKAERYRLTVEEIIDCADLGYELGFKTIVLQSGEDPYYTDDMICEIVKKIKENHPDVAVTLSLGEKERESYQRYYDAGADRYLLRHETINPVHYSKLHPKDMTIEHRVECLKNLKEIGYQVGAGIMVESPYQSIDDIIDDLYFMKEFEPHMVGIGPFIPHRQTPFYKEKAGTLEMTVHLLAIIRLMLPHCLLPATTALGTINPRGRELGILAGANVIMPNLSPKDVRKKYMLYDGKICTGEEAAECILCMKRRMESIGYHIIDSRGDFK